MLLMQTNPLLDFFGPQMALALRLDVISQSPKKSQFPGPNPFPLGLIMDLTALKKHYIRGHINHGSKNS
jgi:hypothetical protein